MWATHSGVSSLPVARVALPWTSNLRSELEPGEEPQASAVRSTVSFEQPFIIGGGPCRLCFQQLGWFCADPAAFSPCP